MEYIMRYLVILFKTLSYLLLNATKVYLTENVL